MPSTINGIGTTYLGKKNLRRHTGVCEKCHQTVALQDYETGLWFSIFFIPIIPLGRKQILDYCPRCTTHRALPVAEWAEVVRSTVEESSSAASSRPESPESAMEHLGTLVALGRGEEAASFAEELLRRFSDNSEVQFNLGGYYEATGQGAKADAAFAKALELDPTSPPARRAVAIGAVEQGDPDRARELLGFMDASEELRDVPLLIVLGEAFQQQGRHEQAVEVFQLALETDAKLAGDRRFRKLVKRSEQALPETASILPARSLLRSRAFRWAAVAAVVVAAASIAEHWASGRAELHVVNGLSVPVRVVFDGEEEIEVAARGRRVVTLRKGDHLARFEGRPGQTSAAKFRIDGSGLMRRWFGEPPIYVLNCFGAGGVMWKSITYSRQPRKVHAAVPKHKLRVGVPFLVFEDVDYVFKDCPDQIELDGMGRPERRTQLSLVEAPPTAVLWSSLWPDLNVDGDLLGYVEAHLRASPGNEVLAIGYLNVAARSGRMPRCRDFFAEALDHRPVRIQWHRLYQSACESTGRARGLPGRYDRMLRESPGDASLLYLRGRLAPLAGDSLAYMDKALAADPKQVFALLGKAFALQCRGRFDQARPLLRAAAKIDPDNDSVSDLLFDMRLATGDLALLEREGRAALDEKPPSPEAAGRLLTVLAVKGDLAAARKVQIGYAEAVSDFHSGDPQQFALDSRLDLLELEGRFPAVLAEAGKLRMARAAERRSFLACLEMGRAAEAETWLAKLEPADWQWQYDLLLSIARHVGGDRAGAQRLRRRAARKMADTSLEGGLLAGLLEQGPAADPGVAEDLTLTSAEKAAALVVLVQSGADQRLLSLAGKLTYHPAPPHRLLKRAIEQLRAEGR